MQAALIPFALGEFPPKHHGLVRQQAEPRVLRGQDAKHHERVRILPIHAAAVAAELVLFFLSQRDDPREGGSCRTRLREEGRRDLAGEADAGRIVLRKRQERAGRIVGIGDRPRTGGDDHRIADRLQGPRRLSA